MKYLVVLTGLCITVWFLQAQDEPPAPTPAPQEETPAAAPAGRGGAPAGRGGATNEPRPYDRVITKDAKTSAGIFKVHTIRDRGVDRYYYEIPPAQMGKDFLFVTQIAKNTLGAGFGGQTVGEMVGRWERRENRILLREVSYDLVADPAEPIAKAVQAANNPSIVMAFNIEAFGPGESAVIEVTRLFLSDVPEMSVRARLRARGMDSSRSFIEHVSAFPENIEAEATHTFTSAPADQQAAGRGVPGPEAAGRGGQRSSSGTVLVHFSMVKLPEKPMLPRLADARVGYFTTSTMDFSRPEHRAERREFVARWRLEKKDPSAALSDPVKPIVYYLDPATPKKWIPYLKKGIESWQPAFEAAGFKHAIIAKEAPTPEEDPSWSPDDVRNSVVRWLPSTTENASGPHISDPRTGEILNADIQFYHNVQQLVEEWYFVQVGPLDPRASKLPLPDDLMGDLLGFVVAHEVGHTLGLQHNMKASSMYPAAKLRDPEWLKTMSHTPSIMDYARFNYVAQPEDKIDPKLLIPGIGPYDKWAIHWAYAPLAAGVSDDESKMLDTWAREQEKTPWLRFTTDRSQGADSGENTEAVGDADAVYSTGLGLKNLSRVMDNLLAATTHEGQDWEDLRTVYGRLVGQWANELGHVTQIVGGFDSFEKHGGQDGVRFTLIPKARQVAAVKFLNEKAFATPVMLLRPEVLRRIEPAGALARIRTAQLQVLNSLLSTQRFGRLVEQEAVDGAAAYRPSEFLVDLRKGIFGEMYGTSVKIDAYRRNLQRAYLELMSTRLNGTPRVNDDQRPMFRGELRTVAADAAAAIARATDRDTRLHLEDLRDQVAKILDPRFQLPTPVALPLVLPQTSDRDDINCWPDYAIGVE